MEPKTKTGWQYLIYLNAECHFMSREQGCKPVSNSELKRWCQNSVLRINGKVIKWDEQIPFPDEIESVTLFTKTKTVTII